MKTNASSVTLNLELQVVKVIGTELPRLSDVCEVCMASSNVGVKLAIEGNCPQYPLLRRDDVTGRAYRVRYVAYRDEVDISAYTHSAQV